MLHFMDDKEKHKLLQRYWVFGFLTMAASLCAIFVPFLRGNIRDVMDWVSYGIYLGTLSESVSFLISLRRWKYS